MRACVHVLCVCVCVCVCARACVMERETGIPSPQIGEIKSTN